MDSSIRLALFVPSMRGGGAERVTAILAAEFAARGYAVDLLLAQKEGPNLEVLPETVRIVDFNARRLISALPALLRYLRRERPTVLLSMMAHTNIVALLACRLAGVATRKVVSERVSLSWRKQQQSNTLLWLIRHLYPWADDIVAVSDGVADELSVVAGISREQIKTIYNPIVRPVLHRKAKASVDHPWFEPGQPPVVLAVGRLCEQKDFITLIRAFAEARQNRPRPARLMILGEGELRPVLETLIAELGLDGDVSLPGFSANPYAYMAQASAFVLSSKWEGLPGVLIEALYCGAPLIATDCPSGPKEILQNGQYGRLVPVGDQEQLAEAINSALDGRIPRPPAESWQPFEQDWVVSRYLDVLLAN